MDYSWTDVVGNLGVALIVAAYLGLQLGRLEGRGVTYALTNLFGASLVLVSLAVDFNLSAVIIEVFWVGISLIGVVRWLRQPRAESGG